MSDGNDNGHVITFRHRPFALAGSLRPIWRIAVILMMVDRCRGRRANMKQLQVLNWAIRTPDMRSRFLSFLDGLVPPDAVIVRFDPSLSRAVAIAIGEQLLAMPHTTNERPIPADAPLELTPRGRSILQELSASKDVLITERTFLDSIGGQLTKSQIDTLFRVHDG